MITLSKIRVELARLRANEKLTDAVVLIATDIDQYGATVHRLHQLERTLLAMRKGHVPPPEEEVVL